MAASDCTRRETRVRFDQSIHIPADETCFYVFEARSAADVVDLANRAGLDATRIVEAFTSGEERA